MKTAPRIQLGLTFGSPGVSMAEKPDEQYMVFPSISYEGDCCMNGSERSMVATYLQYVIVWRKNEVPFTESESNCWQIRHLWAFNHIIPAYSSGGSNEIMEFTYLFGRANHQTGSRVHNRLASARTEYGHLRLINFATDKCQLQHFHLIIALSTQRYLDHVARVMILIAATPRDNAAHFSAAFFVQIDAPHLVSNTALLLHQIRWRNAIAFSNVIECQAHNAIKSGFHKSTSWLWKCLTNNLIPDAAVSNLWRKRSKKLMKISNLFIIDLWKLIEIQNKYTLISSIDSMPSRRPVPYSILNFFKLPLNFVDFFGSYFLCSSEGNSKNQETSDFIVILIMSSFIITASFISWVTVDWWYPEIGWTTVKHHVEHLFWVSHGHWSVINSLNGGDMIELFSDSSRKGKFIGCVRQRDLWGS